MAVQTADSSSLQKGRPTETRTQLSDSNLPTESNIWSQFPEWARHQDMLTDWPTVSRKVTKIDFDLQPYGPPRPVCDVEIKEVFRVWRALQRPPTTHLFFMKTVPESNISAVFCCYVCKQSTYMRKNPHMTY
jgi:hypothetical protein